MPEPSLGWEPLMLAVVPVSSRDLPHTAAALTWVVHGALQQVAEFFRQIYISAEH